MEHSSGCAACIWPERVESGAAAPAPPRTAESGRWARPGVWARGPDSLAQWGVALLAADEVNSSSPAPARWALLRPASQELWADGIDGSPAARGGEGPWDCNDSAQRSGTPPLPRALRPLATWPSAKSAAAAGPHSPAEVSALRQEWRSPGQLGTSIEPLSCAISAYCTDRPSPTLHPITGRESAG